MTERQYWAYRAVGWTTAVCFVAFLSVSSTLAAGGTADEPPAEPGVLDSMHSAASDRVRNFGAWVDSFFANEDYVAEINKTYLRLRLDSYSELYDGTTVEGKARLHLKVPALTDRLRVEILSPGETDDFEQSAPSDVGNADSGATTDKSSAGISYVLKALEKRSIILQAGMDFEKYTPDPFAGARYRETVSITDNWSMRFVQRLRYYSLNGLESRTTLQFDRLFDKNTLFRTGIDGTWLQEQPDYFYNVSLALYRPIDERSAVQYEVIGQFKTDPHRLDRITARIAHRQKIYRDWLVFEVAPQVSFPDEREFRPVPGILFRLEAVFGG